MIRHTGQLVALFIEEELNTFEQKPDRIDGKAQFHRRSSKAQANSVYQEWPAFSQ
jgi:hypothetical protein